jgi:hypothetical protein
MSQQLTIQRKGQWQHALKFKPGKDHATNQTELQLQERFGVATVKGQAGAVSIKKPFIKFGEPEFLTDEMERLIMQNKEFRAFGLRCNWQGNEYFQNYKDIIGRHLTKIYNKVIDQGTEYFDPGHPDAFTPDGFDRFLMAIFAEYVEHKAPAVVVSQKIKSFTYNTLREFDCPVRPKKVSERLDDLWALVDDLPAPGTWQAPNEEDKAQAVYSGLSKEALAFITEEKNVDIFDAMNGGANHYTYAAIFELLEEFWQRKYREISEENQAKALTKKRDRDDDDDSDDYNDRPTKRGRRNDRSNGNDRNNRRNGGNRNRSNGGGRSNDRRNDRGNRNGGGRTNYFTQDCTLSTHGSSANPHQYRDCIFCPTGNNFKSDKAKKFYESGNAPDWYKKAYEKHILKKSPSEQQPQQQQFHNQVQFQPQPGTMYYAGVPPAQASQPPPAAGAVPSYFSNNPGQIAPAFATTQGAPAAQAAQGQAQLYHKRTDAQGRVSFHLA